MNRKLTVALLVSLGGLAYVAGCANSSRLFDDQRQQALAQLNQLPGVQAQWQTLEDGWFRSQGQLHLTLQQAFFEHYLGEEAPVLTAPLEVSSSLFQSFTPWGVTGVGNLDQSRGSLGRWLEKNRQASLPLVLNWQAGLFSSGLNLALALDSGQFANADSQMAWSPLQLSVQGLGEDAIDIQLSWQGVTASAASTQAKMAVQPLSLTLALKRLGRAWYAAQSELRLEGIQLQQPQQQLQLAGLHLRTQETERGTGLDGRLDMHYQLQLDSLRMQEDGDSHRLDKLVLDLTLDGVDRMGYETALNQQQSGAPQEPELALASLSLMGQKGLKIGLSPLQVMIEQAPLTLSGELTLPPYDVTAQPNPLALLQQSQGQLQVELAPQLAEQIPQLAANLDKLLQSGYLRRNELGNLLVEFKLADHRATANGLPLPL
ncbi:MAG: YdgA family protein [Aeromonadaceae bacterium]|nr:YdgA family protein [Aeromonadaceae bacterium]